MKSLRTNREIFLFKLKCYFEILIYSNKYDSSDPPVLHGPDILHEPNILQGP